MLTHGYSQDTEPARVVVLGARGFFASRLCRRLRSDGVNHRPVSREELDLTQPGAAAALARIVTPEDVVVMMSGLTPDRGRDVNALMSNLRMAESVCAMLELTRCRHFIYLSSEAVYGVRKQPLDEESSRQPVNLYGLAHTAREMMLDSVLHERGIPLCILRPANIYGPGDPHGNYGPNRFVRTALAEGRIVLFGRGEERRSHLHIDDTVELVVRAMRRRSAGVLNLVYAPAVTFLKAARIVARHSPRKVEIQFVPRVLPIVHQTYSASAIFTAFPDFSFTPLERGIATYLQAMAAQPGDEPAA